MPDVSWWLLGWIAVSFPAATALGTIHGHRISTRQRRRKKGDR